MQMEEHLNIGGSIAIRGTKGLGKTKLLEHIMKLSANKGHFVGTSMKFCHQRSILEPFGDIAFQLLEKLKSNNDKTKIVPNIGNLSQSWHNLTTYLTRLDLNDVKNVKVNEIKALHAEKFVLKPDEISLFHGDDVDTSMIISRGRKRAAEPHR